MTGDAITVGTYAFPSAKLLLIGRQLPQPRFCDSVSQPAAVHSPAVQADSSLAQ